MRRSPSSATAFALEEGDQFALVLAEVLDHRLRRLVRRAQPEISVLVQLDQDAGASGAGG